MVRHGMLKHSSFLPTSQLKTTTSCDIPPTYWPIKANQRFNLRITPSSNDMAALWDPIQVLDLPVHHNCVGSAARNRHCGTRLHKDNAARIEGILQDMAQSPPGSDAVHALLISLALCGLCKQYHRRQHQVVIAEWVSKIEYHVYLADRTSSSLKEAEQDAVNNLSNSHSDSPRSTPDPPSPHESHVTASVDPDTVSLQGLEGIHLAEIPKLKSATTCTFLLALAIIIIIIIAITIHLLFGIFLASNPLPTEHTTSPSVSSTD